MNIYVLAVCWNEELFLPYFLEYYSFAKKIIIFDNFSSDNSVEIMKKYKNVEYSNYYTNEKIRDDIYLEIKNNIWKLYKNECDWIIIVDIDEIIYHPKGIQNYLLSIPKDISIIQCNGFEMFCNDFINTPGKTIIEKCKFGVSNQYHCKYSIINTKLVNEINYLPGCHIAKPSSKGRVIKDLNVKLLHYKFIYPIPILIHRYSVMAKRLSKYNKDNGLGFHYTNINRMIKKYHNLKKKCINVLLF